MKALRFFLRFRETTQIPIKFQQNSYVQDIRQNLYHNNTLIATKVLFFENDIFVKQKQIFKLTSNKPELLYTLPKTPLFFFNFENKLSTILRDGKFFHLETNTQLYSMEQPVLAYYENIKRVHIIPFSSSIPSAIDFASEFTGKIAEIDVSAVIDDFNVINLVSALHGQNLYFNATLLIFSLCYVYKDEIIYLMQEYVRSDKFVRDDAFFAQLQYLVNFNVFSLI